MSHREDSKALEHINQHVTGHIAFGNAGVSKQHKRLGYVCHLCTTNPNGRFVDLMLKREHLEEIKNQIDYWIELTDSQSSTQKVSEDA